MLDFLKINYYGISIFIIITISFICFYLYLKVKLLKQQIKDLNNIDIKKDNTTIKTNDDDIIPIKEISDEIKDIPKNIKEDNNIEIKKTSTKMNKNNKHKIELYQPEFKKNQAYSKNILNKNLKTTSPISLNNNKEFNIKDFAPDSKNNSLNYLNRVSKEIEKEIKSQTIELTEYEKQEEDNAIISYKELLNAKNKKNNIPDKEETLDFIEELKKLRNSLE